MNNLVIVSRSGRREKKQFDTLKDMLTAADEFVRDHPTYQKLDVMHNATNQASLIIIEKYME